MTTAEWTAIGLGLLGVLVTVLLATSAPSRIRSWREARRDRRRLEKIGSALGESQRIKELPRSFDAKPPEFGNMYMIYRKSIEEDHAKAMAGVVGLDSKHADSLMEQVAAYHERIADRHYARTSTYDDFMTSYHYLLAAIAYQKAGQFKKAGHRAHWAGHSFRGRNEPKAAAEAYCYSADCFERVPELGEERVRSARRAVACLREIFEISRADVVEQVHIESDSEANRWWLSEGLFEPINSDRHGSG